MVLISVIGFSVAFAQDNTKNESNVSKLAIKVADILGLDSTVVDAAIKEAARELRHSAAKKKLNGLVEKGLLTQDQANEKFDWIQSRASQSPAMKKRLFRSKGHHRHWNWKRIGHLSKVNKQGEIP